MFSEYRHNCAVSSGKNLTFIKGQEASGLQLVPNSSFSRILLISNNL